MVNEADGLICDGSVLPEACLCMVLHYRIIPSISLQDIHNREIVVV